MEPQSNEWLYDYILQFLKSPGWRLPILNFIDNHCHYFTSQQENKLEYTSIFNQFKDTIDTLLGNLCSEIGVTQQNFAGAYQRGLQNPQHRKIFQQILACDNFSSFKKLMIKRNKELELEAMTVLQKQGEVSPQEMQIAASQKQQADIQHAIQLSLACQEAEKKHQSVQESMLQKALRESEMQFKRENDIRNQEKQMKKPQQIPTVQQNQTVSEEKTRNQEENTRNQEEKTRNQEEKRKRLAEEQARIKAVEEAKAERERIKKEKRQAKERLKKEQENLKIQEEKNKKLLQERLAREQQKLKEEQEEKIRSEQALKELKQQKKIAKMEQLKKQQTIKAAEKKQKEQEQAKLQKKKRKQERAAKKQAKIQKQREAKRKFDEAEAQRAQAEIKQALDSTYKKQTQKAKAKAHLGQLPPVQPRKVLTKDLFDPLAMSAAPVQVQLTQQSPTKPSREEPVQVRRQETLQERQERMKKQRELLQAKLNKDREAEMKVYMENGGVDLMKKPMEPLPNLMSQAELEKRQSIVEKLKIIDL